MSKVNCENCSESWFCKIIHWCGSRPLLTVYDYVQKYNIENCHFYKRKWWKIG